jgi:Tfp pilus assembly protein PilP
MTRWTGAGLGLLAAVALAAAAARAEPAAPPARAEPSNTEVARTTEPAGDIPYDPTGRRDPFRPPRVGNSAHTGEQRTPLQRYEIAQLRLVAVIYDTKDPRAVVEDDQGLGYIVHVGTPIGPNGGEVRGIERGRVRITEDSVDYYGEHRENDVTMELRTTERGK